MVGKQRGGWKGAFTTQAWAKLGTGIVRAQQRSLKADPRGEQLR